MVAGVLRQRPLPEHDDRVPVLLPPDGTQDVVRAAVEGVGPRGGAVAGVVVADPVVWVGKEIIFTLCDTVNTSKF